MHAPDPSLVIRPARRDDASRLSGLLGELGYPAPVDVVVERLATLERAGETILVATRDGTAIGFVSVHLMRVLHRPTPVGRMSALVVTSAERARGVGRALVAAAEAHVAAAGAALIEVTSRRELVDAHAFYRRLGYDVTSFRFGKVFG